MVAGLLSHLKRQFILPKIIGIHFSFITKIPGDTLLMKMPAEFPSTEHLFTKTSRLVALLVEHCTGKAKAMRANCIQSLIWFFRLHQNFFNCEHYYEDHFFISCLQVTFIIDCFRYVTQGFVFMLRH